MSADPVATRRILRLALPPAGRLWRAIALGVLSAGSAVALLAVSAWLITRAAEQPSIIYVSMAVVGVRAFALGRAFFRYLERLSGHDAAFRQLATIRSELFGRLVPLAPDGLGDTRRGDLLSGVANDVDELQNHSLRVVQPLVTAGVIALISVGGVFVLLPEAGVSLLVALALAFVAGTLVNRWVSGRAEREIAPLRAEVNDSILDLVGRLDVLTAFGALPQAERRVSEAGDRLTAALRSRAAGVGLTTAIVSVLAGAATAFALMAGIPALGTHRLDAPTLAVVALLPLAVFEIFGMVPLALGAYRQLHASAERLAAVAPASLPAGIPADAAVTVPLTARSVPSVELTGLSAHWPGQTQSVLEDVTLRLAPGERVLLTGPTGAGKTALAHVLTRFIDYSGGFTVDGVEAKDAAQDEVRRVIGLCEQHPYLFDSDLRQNLLFARDTATDEELLAVLDRVGLTEWVQERGGLTADVGERGALVSGGQAQRIALARAILADFAVLVVDEPTANVDAAVAARIVDDILTTAAEDGRTVLLISHTPVADGLLTRRVHLDAGRLA
ncbi:thiol reductant ABC exporter subunit CydC [Leifsonia poae]|uniref:thiol reductant ABC exporter subunit CydC n=1 Tax=Leifsonia poae TaxID=110933 RepID=UPI001CBE97A5|nr:thiol reductant ABC exporter subunit CydC [Leifsonia poae]